MIGLACGMKVLLEICPTEVVGESHSLFLYGFLFFLNLNVDKLFKPFSFNGNSI